MHLNKDGKLSREVVLVGNADLTLVITEPLTQRKEEDVPVKISARWVGWGGWVPGVGVGRSVARSVGQSVARSLARSVARSVGRLVGRSVGRSVARSVKCACLHSQVVSSSQLSHS